MSEFDPVARPSHYAEGRQYEPIDVIEDWALGFHEANALKYISRSGRKDNQIQDLEKAVWYLERRISQLEDAADVEAASKAREEALIEGAVFNITLNKAEDIASDGLDLDEAAGEVGNADAKHVGTVRAAKVMASNPGLYI